MTTLIVVAIVGLVFFVTICVAGFMIWKRETEIRTDSIGAIERSIGDVVNELSGINSEMSTAADTDTDYPEPVSADRGAYAYVRGYDRPYETYDIRDRAYEKAAGNNGGRITNNGRREPYQWTRSDERNAGNISVFRPGRNTSRRLRWTEMPGGAESARTNKARPASRGAGRFRNMRRADEGSQSTEYTEMPESMATSPVDIQNFKPHFENEYEPDFNQGFVQSFEAESETEYAHDSGQYLNRQQEQQMAPHHYDYEQEVISSAPYAASAANEQRAFYEKGSSSVKSPGNLPEKTEKTEKTAGTESVGKLQDEINLSVIDLDDLDSISLDEFELFDDNDGADTDTETHAGYNTGRSGKKYTAQELETLIKE